jgi:hypothetical protein
VLECGIGLKGYGEARKSLNAMEEGWVERETVGGEREQSGGIMGILSGEHAGCGGGGVGESGVAFEDGDAGASCVEFESKGEADDASTDDDNI